MASITKATINNGGAGYAVNDVLTVVQAGGSGGTLKVTGVAGGVVDGISILTGGTGYSTTTALATTVAPAGGSGCTISIYDIFTYEGVKSRVRRRTSGRGWTRKVEISAIPYSVVDTYLPAEFSAYPGESGKHAAVLIGSDVDDDHIPRNTAAGGMVSLVRLFYRQRTPEEWLLANPNNFVMIRSGAGYPGAVDTTKVRVKDDNRTTTVTSTLTRAYGSRPIFRVYGYTNDLATYATPYLGKVWTVNSDTLTKFGAWNAVGYLMLLDFLCRPAVAGSSLYQINWTLTGKFLPAGIISHSTHRVGKIETSKLDGTSDGALAKKKHIDLYHGYSNSTVGGHAGTVAMTAINDAIIDW